MSSQDIGHIMKSSDLDVIWCAYSIPNYELNRGRFIIDFVAQIPTEFP